MLDESVIEFKDMLKEKFPDSLEYAKESLEKMDMLINELWRRKDGDLFGIDEFFEMYFPEDDRISMLIRSLEAAGYHDLPEPEIQDGIFNLITTVILLVGLAFKNGEVSYE